jgi:nucleotide-binding universal stress UspA family protein
MLAIHRILCPVDFSEPSARALEYALALTERLGAQVDVVHTEQVVRGSEVPVPTIRSAGSP